MRLSVAIAVACLSIAGLSTADEVQAAVKKQTNISAQGLGPALQTLAKDRNFQIVYVSEEINDLRTPGAVGEFTPEEALATLLIGTGLTFKYLDEQTVTIVPAAAGSSSPVIAGSPSSAGIHASSPAVGEGKGEERRRGFLERFRLAQADQPPGVDDPSVERARVQTSDSKGNVIAEIVVVDSRLGTSADESAQPVVVISREDINRSGASSVAQVLSQRPEVSVSNQGDNSGTRDQFNLTSVQLRGLPIGTTLVLVNGRRISNTAITSQRDFFDLSSLPLALVDHIEILPVGSSAIYGGDALGGVVNIVLKRDAQGFDLSTRYAFADGYDETQTSLTWGRSGSRGSLTLMGTYAKNHELHQSERGLTADRDYTRFGGVDDRVTFSNPGNVYSLAGCPPAPELCFVPLDQRGNLPGLEAPFAAVPAGSTGVGMTPTDFAATAGTLNRDTPLIPIFTPAEHYGVLVSGRYQLTRAVELFTEWTYTRNEVDGFGEDAVLGGGDFGLYRVSADHPFNPFGVDVGVDFRIPEAVPPQTLRSDNLRALMGARGDLGVWEWELAGWQSRDKADRGSFDSGEGLQTALMSALASQDPATTLNPFQDGPGGSPEALASLLIPVPDAAFESELRGVNGFVHGPLWQLPAGALRVLLGGEYEQQDLDFDNSSVDGDRSKHAFFSEIRVPLLAGRSRERLALMGALRADRDSSFAGTGRSEQIGLEYRPVPSLLLRAAYNTAFKPPTLFTASRDPRTSVTATVRDPRMDGALTVIERITQGVPPSIQPERGRSRTLGLVFSVPQEPLSLTLTHWDNEIQDRISFTTAQFLVDHEADFPGRVIRDPVTGIITKVDAREININFLNLAGLDLGVNGRWHTRFGEFLPALAATYTYEYESQISPLSPPVDGVSAANLDGYAPLWKGTLQVGWQAYDWYAQLAGRYVSRYRDFAPLSSGPQAGTYQQLGDVWFLDLNVNYALGRALAPSSGVMSGTTLSFGAVNLLNRLPDFANIGGLGGYDATQYDIRGRYAYAQLTLSF